MRYCRNFFLVYILIFSAVSCTSGADFDQIEQIEITQRLTSPFLFYDLDQTKFLNADGSTEIPMTSDESVVDIFRTSYVADNLVKADFSFEIANTFNRNFEIQLSFVDENNITTQTIFLSALGRNTSISMMSFENEALDLLKNSIGVRVNINLLPSGDSSVLDINEDMMLTIQSSVIFTLVIT